MHTIETMAIAKAITDNQVKKLREEMAPGKYAVDVTVHIQGTVSVAEDTDRAATSNLMSQEFFLLVLHKAGFMRNQAMQIIQDTATEYLKEWTGSDEDKKQAKAMRQAMLQECDPEGQMKAFLAETKINLPRVPVKGSVKFVGQVEEVAADADAALAMVG